MMYALCLTLHSVLRWVVLFGGAWALVQAWDGLSKGRAYNDRDRKATLVYVSAIHLNLVLGLLLYLLLSPQTTTQFAAFGAAMKNAPVRFFLVEHPFGMLVAVVLATVGSARVKRAPTDVAKHKRALWFFGLSLAIILLSIPWPFYAAGRPLLSVAL